jgi:hypothetical protein
VGVSPAKKEVVQEHVQQLENIFQLKKKQVGRYPLVI